MQMEKNEFNASGDIDKALPLHNNLPLALAKSAGGRHTILKEGLTLPAGTAPRTWLAAAATAQIRAEARRRMAYLQVIRSFRSHLKLFGS
jgi:hypothetical protein